MDWYPHTQTPRLLTPTDPYTLHPWYLVTILDPSAALLLPPHLLHGHKTMGLQAITSRGLARGHRRVRSVPSFLPTVREEDSASRAPGVLPSLTRHTPILSSLNQWCEQLDSVWTWGKGELPWEGPAAKSGKVSPQKWGPGNTGPAPPPLHSPIFVLLVCFFNLTSAAVYLSVPIFPPSPSHFFPPALPSLGWGGGGCGFPFISPHGRPGLDSVSPSAGVGPQHLSGS